MGREVHTYTLCSSHVGLVVELEQVSRTRLLIRTCSVRDAVARISETEREGGKLELQLESNDAGRYLAIDSMYRRT